MTAMTVGVNAVGAVLGGATRHLTPFLAALVRARPEWRVHVWANSDADPSGWSREVCTTIVPRLTPRERLWWETAELPSEVRRVEADVLVNLTNSAPITCPVPSVLYQRNALWFDRRWTRSLTGLPALEARVRRVLAYVHARRSSAVVVPSGAMAGFLLDWEPWPKGTPLRVIPHGVDSERFSFAPRGWPPPPNRPVKLLSVGHGYPHKEQLLLVDLVAELAARGQAAELTLTVDTDDRSGLGNRIREHAHARGVGESILLVGDVEEPDALYREADISISASITESFGFTVAEAMASGTPVVASRIPATTELAGSEAHYFETGDATGAALAVLRLLSCSRSSVSTMIRDARTRVEGLTWSTNANSVALLLEACRGNP